MYEVEESMWKETEEKLEIREMWQLSHRGRQ